MIVLKDYLDLLEGNLPGVCFADDKGKVFFAGSLPDTVDGFMEKAGVK